MATLTHDGLEIEHYQALVVLGALVLLALIARGFRGGSVGGVSLKVN